MISSTPKTPYYAVIFSSIKNENINDYAETSTRMVELAKQQEGFLGIESANGEPDITVSYWKDLESIKKWKANYEHQLAQEKGKTEWYKAFKTRITLVERDYGFNV